MKTLKPYRETLSIRKCASALAMSACLALLLLANSASAATIAQYTFENNLAASGVDPNATATEIGKGSGLPTSAITAAQKHGGTYSFQFAQGDITGPKLDDAKKASDYIYFTVSANDNYMLNLNAQSLTFWGAGSDNNGRFGVEYQLNGSGDFAYLGTLATSLGTDWRQAEHLYLGESGFDGLNSITFQIYGWNTVAAQNQWIDDISLGGAVVAVPEVGTMGPSMLVIGLAIVSSLRFRKNKTE